MNQTLNQNIRNFAFKHSRAIRYLRYQSFAISIIASLVMIVPLLFMNGGLAFLALPLIIMMMLVANIFVVFIVFVAPFLRWERYMTGKNPLFATIGFLIVAIFAPLAMSVWAFSTIRLYIFSS